MASSGVKICGVLSIVVVLLAILYKKNNDEVLRERLQSVLTGLLQAEKQGLQAETGRERRVAVGFGACLDVFGSAVEVLEKAGAQASDEPDHFNHIKDLDEVEKVFAYFFRHGAAAEYVVIYNMPSTTHYIV